MTAKTEVYILSVLNHLASISLASWVYLDAKREVFFIDPSQGKEEVWALKRLAERMPVVSYDLTGDDSFGEMLAEEKDLLVKKQHFHLSLQELGNLFGRPKGLITASSLSSAHCLKGAILAVSLGFGFLPDVFERNFIFPGWEESSFPVFFVGAPEDIPGDKQQENELIFLRDDADYYSLLVTQGRTPDYLLMLNSTDILDHKTGGSSLSSLRVKGLSLLGLVLASYRQVFLFDIFQKNPDSREVEKKVNQWAKLLDFTPKFQAILGAPGACPFIIGGNKEIAGSGEEPLRDIHLQLNHDLFFDVAEGRLFQSTPGGLSLQLLSTKHYQRIRPASGSRVLIAAAPHVETGIIFDSDRGLIEGKLKPLLEKAGYQVSLLTEKEASAHQVVDSLTSSDYFLYSGHGSAKSLNTHRYFLTREDLPDLPPLVAYASACSTISVRPDWLSLTEGLDWEEIEIPPREVIGLSLVEKGAVCFIGGATTEDFQFTSSVYSLFFESLLLKGMSVGAALNETRNFTSLYGTVLNQKAREAYQISQEGISNIIHQQILLGDPALIPCPKIVGDLPLIKHISPKGEEYEISLEIPPDCWKKVEVPIHDKAPTRDYYRTRSIEHVVPLIPDIISWGDFYHLALDRNGISEKALMSGFLHLDFDFPPGRAPEKLELVRANGRGACLFCGGDSGNKEDFTKFWRSFVLPYQMLPPVNFDMTSGWPFGVEDLGVTSRVHWLVPVMVIDERTRRGYLGESFIFKLKTAPGKYLTGKVADRGEKGRPFLIQTDRSLIQAVSDLNGEFRILSGENDVHVTVEGQFPLFDLWGDYLSWERELHPIDGENRLEINIKRTKECLFKGRVMDSLSGEPVSSALIRAWRGKLDPCGYALREGWAGETCTDKGGCFTLILAKGDYLLDLAAKENSRRYKSKEIPFTVGEDEQYAIYSLDRAGMVHGKITFENYFPPSPTLVLKKYAQDAGETLSSVPIRNDGTFECLVGFQDRFCIVIEKEGWQGIRDTNFDRGYKLKPEEILYREYFLKIKDDYK